MPLLGVSCARLLKARPNRPKYGVSGDARGFSELVSLGFSELVSEKSQLESLVETCLLESLVNGRIFR